MVLIFTRLVVLLFSTVIATVNPMVNNEFTLPTSTSSVFLSSDQSVKFTKIKELISKAAVKVAKTLLEIPESRTHPNANYFEDVVGTIIGHFHNTLDIKLIYSSGIESQPKKHDVSLFTGPNVVKTVENATIESFKDLNLSSLNINFIPRKVLELFNPTRLNLDNTGVSENLTVLSFLPSITDLSLRHNKIKTIGFLNNLNENVKQISISFNEISISDIDLDNYNNTTLVSINMTRQPNTPDPIMKIVEYMNIEISNILKFYRENQITQDGSQTKRRFVLNNLVLFANFWDRIVKCIILIEQLLRGLESDAEVLKNEVLKNSNWCTLIIQMDNSTVENGEMVLERIEKLHNSISLQLLSEDCCGSLSKLFETMRSCNVPLHNDDAKKFLEAKWIIIGNLCLKLNAEKFSLLQVVTRDKCNVFTFLRYRTPSSSNQPSMYRLVGQ